MKHYIDKDALVAEIEKRQRMLDLDNPLGRGGMVELQWLKNKLDTLEVIDPYEQFIQYASIESGIKAHAETYSFNIESELFSQLTKEQQKLWREEIEEACISGGDTGYLLAKDPRYKENLKVKEVDFEEYYHKFLQKEWFGNSHVRTLSEFMAFTAKHFFELGLKAQKEEKVITCIPPTPSPAQSRDQ